MGEKSLTAEHKQKDEYKLPILNHGQEREELKGGKKEKLNNDEERENKRSRQVNFTVTKIRMTAMAPTHPQLAENWVHSL